MSASCVYVFVCVHAYLYICSCMGMDLSSMHGCVIVCVHAAINAHFIRVSHGLNHAVDPWVGSEMMDMHPYSGHSLLVNFVTKNLGIRPKICRF